MASHSWVNWESMFPELRVLESCMHTNTAGLWSTAVAVLPQKTLGGHSSASLLLLGESATPLMLARAWWPRRLPACQHTGRAAHADQGFQCPPQPLAPQP